MPFLSILVSIFLAREPQNMHIYSQKASAQNSLCGPFELAAGHPLLNDQTEQAEPASLSDSESLNKTTYVELQSAHLSIFEMAFPMATG